MRNVIAAMAIAHAGKLTTFGYLLISLPSIFHIRYGVPPEPGATTVLSFIFGFIAAAAGLICMKARLDRPAGD